MKSLKNSNFEGLYLKGNTSVIDNIYGISIYDMISEKIHFLCKLPHLNFNYFLSVIKNRFRKTSLEYKPIILREPIIFIYKSKEYFINSRVKLNLTIINEVIICILYNPLLIDEIASKLLNQRLLETLIMLSNTKMIKMEFLVKKYVEVNLILEDFLYLIDPRLRFKFKKNEEILARKAILHSPFIIKLKVGVEMMNEYFSFSFLRRFKHITKNLENFKKLRCKIFYNSIDMELIKYKMLNNQESYKMSFNHEMKKFYLEKKLDRNRLYNNDSFINKYHNNHFNVGNFNNILPFNTFNRENLNNKLVNETTNINLNVNFSEINAANNVAKSKNSLNNLGEAFIDVDQLINNVKPYITKTDSQSTGSSRLSVTDDSNKSSRMGIHKVDWTKSIIRDNLSPPKKARNSKSLEKMKNKENELNKSEIDIRQSHILNNSDGHVNSNNIRHSLNKDFFELEFNKSKVSTSGIGKINKNEGFNAVERVNKFADFEERDFNFDQLDKNEKSNKLIMCHNFDNSKNISTNISNNKLENQSQINSENIFKNFNFTPSPDKEKKEVFNFELEQNFITELNKNTITTLINKEISYPITHNNFDPSVLHPGEASNLRSSLPSYDSLTNDHTKKLDIGELNEKKEIVSDKDLDLLDIDLPAAYKRVLDKKEDVFNPATIKNNLWGSINEKEITVFRNGKFEEIEYKGQIRLELRKNFEIKNKILFVKIFHDKWKDSKSFKIEILDNKNVELIDKDESNMRNVKDLFKILTYNIDKKIIDKIIDFKFIKSLDSSNQIFNLKLQFNLLKKNLKRFKNCTLTIILNFNLNIKFSIDKSSKSQFKHDQTNNTITYTFKNFLELELFEINLLLRLINSTADNKILESINLKYLYEDFVLTFNAIDITYQDEFNQINHLNIIKRCLQEQEYQM